MKLIGIIVVISIPVLAGLMSIHEIESEGQIGNPPYLWTRHITEPWYVHVGHTDIHGSPSFSRRRFGFPSPAMILDTSTTNGSWYAKICLPRLAVNGLVALGISATLITGTHLMRKRKKSEQMHAEATSKSARRAASEASDA